MKIGNFLIRKPIGRYETVEFEELVYWEMRRSLLEDMLRETNKRIAEINAL